MEPNGHETWSSRIGFILAASGSAIGLGNIVFFPANAYKYGGGAFYVPYFIALFLIGIPIMMLELGAGRFTGKGLPGALKQTGGRLGEAAGWFCILNASVITMYYITILGWVVGMWTGCFKSLWEPSAVPAFGLGEGVLSNSMSYFFNMISRFDTIAFVAVVWLLNILIVMWGAKSIERAVKWFVPLMWIMMIVLIVRGVTLPDGLQGVYLLFTPDFSVMKQPAVWQGAFSQMFFSLSLGLGIMTAYASYLPKNTDDSDNARTISLMNCSFEFIAGLAIFSLLFAFAITPKASTLSMMFFIVPEGIAKFPFAVRAFGLLFFTLLLLAGLSSSASLFESLIRSVLDKFNLTRKQVVLGLGTFCFLGSVGFTMPHIIDKGLNGDGTLGLTLLDVFDHWAFGYGLLVTGLLECIILGWVFDIGKIRNFLNESRPNGKPIGKWFEVMVRYVLPVVILSILVLSAHGEIKAGLYDVPSSIPKLSVVSFVAWLVFTIGGSFILSRVTGRKGGVQ